MLNLSDVEIQRAGDLLKEFLRGYEKSLPDRAVFPPLDRAVLTALSAGSFPNEGLGVDRLFQLIDEQVVPNSTATAGPRYLAYVLGTPNGIAPFADAIATALNQNCNFWQLSPAASVIERKVVEWLASLFEFPDTAGGIITSGGSMATLIALAAALNDKFPGDFRRAGLQSGHAPMVLYTSEEAHRCVDKAAATLGIGLNNVRKIPVDKQFRLRADLLEQAIRDDRIAGKHPFCVVAAGGTINTGAIDPIASLAEVCARENLWLHVDGAFGALFVLSGQYREELLPCGLADSIALDPHKLLFSSLEAGCVIMRDKQKLRDAFRFSSSYLPAEEDPLFTDFMDYGPQLSRSFKAFKIWCSLQAFGVKAFVAAIDHTLNMTRYMQSQICADQAFELLAPVGLNAICFRLRNVSDEENRAALAQLVRDGTAILGPVRIDGRFGMRACIANYRTQESDIDLILRRLSYLRSSEFIGG